MRQLCFLPACSQPPGLSKKLLSLPVTPPHSAPLSLAGSSLRPIKEGKGKQKGGVSYWEMAGLSVYTEGVPYYTTL